MRRVNKGFLLVDSLITVLVCSLVCVLTYSIFSTNNNYIEGYRKYQIESNERLTYYLRGLNQCETCEIIDESD